MGMLQSRAAYVVRISLLLAIIAACGTTPSGQAAMAERSSLAYDPNALYVMDVATLRGLTFGAQVTFQSLQGIVNREAPPQIFLRVEDGERHDGDWLQWLAQGYGVSYVPQNDLAWYLATFRDRLQGYVLFDSRQPDSVNVALSVAGVLDAIAVDVRDDWLVRGVEKLGLTRLLDVRDRDYEWLRQSEYWARLDKDGIVQLHPLAGLPNLRDFGVARRMAFFFNDTPRDPDFQLMRRMIADLNPGAEIYGWGYTDKQYPESGFVGTATVAGLGTIPADQAGNLSVYMHYPPREPLRRPPMPTLPTETNVHYVTFIVSDGDNVQVILNKFAHPAHDLYASAKRGQVPIGWTLPPALARVAPPILEWIYRQATPNDDFLAGPAGWAYVYPSVWPDRATLGARTASWMALADMRALVSLDINQGGIGFNADVMRAFTAQSNIDGLFFSAYDWSDPPPGSMLWVDGKPVFAMERLGYVKPARQEIAALADRINARPRDATSPAGYTAVYAHIWGTTVSDLVALADRLGPDVRVVRPDVFLALASRNIRR